jgi:hypothetical protein
MHDRSGNVIHQPPPPHAPPLSKPDEPCELNAALSPVPMYG